MKIAPAALLCLLISSICSAQWHQLPGPPAGGPIAYAKSSDGKTIFAATPDGVCSASQIQGPWLVAGLRAQSVSAIGDFFFSGQGDVMFASVDTEINFNTISAALLRSIDSGKSWQIVWRDTTLATVLSVSKDGANLVLILANPDSTNAVLISSDVGSTWHHNLAAPPGNISAVTATQNYYFAIGSNNRIWRLPRNGGGWQLTSFPVWQQPLSITTYGEDIFVGAIGHVDFSTDNGASWITTLSYGLDTSNDRISQLAVNGLTLVAAGPTGIFSSTNGAQSWGKIDPAADGYALKFFDNSFLLSRPAGLFVSTDGLAWHYVSFPNEYHLVSGLATNDTTLFALAQGIRYEGNSVSQSTDHGATWQPSPVLYGVWKIVQSSGSIIAVGGQMIWRWQNNNWQEFPTSRSIGFGGAAAIGDTLFYADGFNGIYRLDQGSWSHLYQFPGQIYTSNLFSVQDTLFVLSNDFAWNLYASTDLGNSWLLRHSFPDTGGAFQSLVAISGDTIALALYSHQNRLYVSQDAGHTWQSNTENANAIGFAANALLSELHDRTPKGLYNASAGFRFMESDSITSLIQSIAADDSLVYLGTTQKGLWANAIANLPLSVRAEHTLANMPVEIFPNPSRAKTTIDFTLTERGEVSISIVNELGISVRTRQDEMEAGVHSTPIETSDLPSGIYTVRITNANQIAVQELVVAH